MCGGTRANPLTAVSPEGLSPRVRGNHPALGEDSLTARVYPRVCGGTGHGERCPYPVQGLSPRVRGNRPTAAFKTIALRSIPACAGEPVRVGRFGKPVGVYPRVCGGTTVRIEPERRCYGLSPRVRGNLNHVRISKSQHGSIPACAGEPELPRCTINRCRVYPRVCGGTSNRGSDAIYMQGLSPRVRGNPINGSRPGALARSIPACAGEPTMSLNTPSTNTVYPRVCGGT